MIKIHVAASRQYDVILNKGILSMTGMYVKDALGLQDDPITGKLKNKKICIVTDETVDPLYGRENQTLWRSLTLTGFEVHKYVFPGGEDSKNMETIEELLEFLAAKRFTRTDVLLALGGGIVGDVTGFAAATYLRGIEFIQVPTTLLAIVDSSVGGKTGVNLKAGKNLAGAFWQPSLVLFDSEFLDTLSYDIKLDGIAEAIKAGIIAEPLILDSIKMKRTLDDPDFLMNLASLAIEVKRKVVEEDERDNGSRQLLNLGHTLAHAIEKCSGYAIPHGHAVAAGLAIIARSAEHLGWAEEPIAARIAACLMKNGLPTDTEYPPEALAEAALADKKRAGGDITLVVPLRIGNCALRKMPVTELLPVISAGWEA